MSSQRQADTGPHRQHSQYSRPAIVPLRGLQSLQHSFLCRACRVKSSIPIEVVFQELSVTPWHDFWWRQVLSFWKALAQADLGSTISVVLHDAIAIANETPCETSESSATLQCSWGLPSRLGRPERERENFTSPFSQHWLMRTRLCWSHQPH